MSTYLFEQELQNISYTVSWSFTEADILKLEQMVSSLKPFPLLVVGSGGSLSGAYFVARLHEQMTGQMAKPITPLEFILSPVKPDKYAVLFLTASGNNKDILNAFEISIQREFLLIGVTCARLESKISQKARCYPYVKYFEFSNPSGKDGFLAVNSLLSTSILIARAYKAIDTKININEQLLETAQAIDNQKWQNILTKKTIVALGGQWSWPAVIDLESKFTEAALVNVLISDLRNFGHGRHNWFDKKGDESALLILDTPYITSLSQKIVNYLPAKYPSAILQSSHDGPLGCLELFIKVFYLVNKAGKIKSIDPAKPKVPEFGRKIYHISSYPTSFKRKTRNKDVWVQRKVKAANQPYDIVLNYLEKFLNTLKHTIFSGIVFDYDGTLCDPPERFTKVIPEIGEALNNLLSKDIPIAIATGRGHSVQESLCQVISEEYWSKIIIGNYNGSIIHKELNNTSQFSQQISEIISDIYQVLKEDIFLTNYSDIHVRYKQISITPKLVLMKKAILKRVLEILNNHIRKIKIVQSDHSIDIFELDVSKLHVVDALVSNINNKNQNILVIGDQGQFGGNDFDLLSSSYSLSVDKISTSLSTCWNLSPVGLRGARAVLSVVRAIKFENTTFFLDIDYLSRDTNK